MFLSFPQPSAASLHETHGVLPSDPDQPGVSTNKSWSTSQSFKSCVSLVPLTPANRRHQRFGVSLTPLELPVTSSQRLADHSTYPHSVPPSHASAICVIPWPQRIANPFSHSAFGVRSALKLTFASTKTGNRRTNYASRRSTRRL